MKTTKKIISVQLDAYTDHGTGYTSTQQGRWMADAVRRIMSALHRVQCPARIAWDPENRKVMVLLSCPYSADRWNGRTDATDAAIARIAETVKSGEEVVREIVGKEMGRHAAYCTVRTHTGGWPVSVEEVAGNMYILPEVLGGGRVSA